MITMELEAPVRVAPQPEEAGAAGPDRPVIVLVDDEPQVLQALRRLLRREPYELLTTSRPIEALQWVRSRPVNLLVTDHRMPLMNGAELLKDVRIESPRTVRVMLTAYAGDRPVARELGQAIDHVICKPWDDELMKETIRAMIRWPRRPAPGPAPASHDFTDEVVAVDCRDRTSAELMERLAPRLSPPCPTANHLVLFLQNLYELRDPISRLMAALEETVVASGVSAAVLDPSGGAATMQPTLGPNSPLSILELSANVLKPRQILLLEDREDVIEWFRALVEPLGHDLEAVRRPVEAMERAERRLYDLMLLDVDLEAGTGDALLQRLQAKPLWMPVVPIVGSTTPPWMRTRIVKPYGVSSVLKAMEWALL